MTSPSDEATDDSFWRRPLGPPEPEPPTPGPAASAPATPNPPAPGPLVIPPPAVEPVATQPWTADPQPWTADQATQPWTVEPATGQAWAARSMLDRGPTDATESAPGGYAGPPQGAVPPPGWRPPVQVQPAPPRPLPGQDIPAVEAAEASARTLTYGVGLIAGAVLLVVMCLLCSRVLF
ncbi:hypothetical protein ACIBF5_14560 [Micromonospora sp. NPDC050417]|uniref:hypothetical protein n=1 Tax=Micromonospora sp. NPDC050417 TaxID=3364280 RepID=UPI0037875831